MIDLSSRMVASVCGCLDPKMPALPLSSWHAWQPADHSRSMTRPMTDPGADGSRYEQAGPDERRGGR